MSYPSIEAAINAVVPHLAAARKVLSLSVAPANHAATFAEGEPNDVAAIAAAARVAGFLWLEFARHEGGAATLSGCIADGHAFACGMTRRQLNAVGTATHQGFMPAYDVTATPPEPEAPKAEEPTAE